MAFIIKDRVKEATTSTGTGAVSLGGAAATFDTFQSYMTNGDTTYYAIVHTTSGTDEWEVGLGTWNTGNTLTRTTVLAGSNGTSAVTFSAGTKDVFMTYPASKAAVAGEDVTFADITVTGTVDGRDVAADGTKLDGIDTSADVTDATTVAAAGALMKSGGTMTGNLILNADPTTALGAATKEYVDTIASAGIHYHDPVRVEAPSALTVTYDNGSSGVGATLTNAGTQAAITIDGVALSLNDRVLIYKQTDQTQNGVYTVTTVGSASTNWVLTRATDCDSYGASDPDSFGKGDAFFVKEGNTGAGELYVMTTAGTITFGTTNIVFSQVAETAVYSAGTGLTLTGTTFSIGQDVATSANVTFNQVTAAIIGNVTGNLTGDVTGNADTATALETARTIQLSGDVTGSASFDGSANINITAAVQDDSHAHVISNVDGLQAALDGKTATTRTLTAGNGLTGGGDLSANRTFTVGAGTGVTVNANDVAIGQDVATTATPTFAGATFTGNTYWGDLDTAIWGTGNDLQVYHDGNSVISSANGTLFIQNTSDDADIRFRSDNGTGGVADYIMIDGSAGAVNLYHYGSKKFNTNSSGITVTGNIVVDGNVDGRDISGITATNAELNILDGVTATTTELNYVDGVTSNIQTQLNTLTNTKANGSTTISAGGGLTGGGSLGANRTISHADTSSQASVNNSMPNVIQDITLDTYGHITNIASANLDDRYYTESEADSRFVNASGDSMTGTLTIDNGNMIRFDRSGGNAHQRADARLDGSDQARLHWYGKSDSQVTRNFKHAWYDGANYINVTASGSGRIDFTGSASTMYIGSDRVFDDGYHPNADKWTTARTLSLSGDASGSVSWDGSANATLSVTVANDSHNHNHSDGGFTVNGHLANTGGAKLEIMNGTDGGTSKGIWMWSSGDNNWVQYMSQSGSGKAPDGGTAPLPISGGTSHQYRFRAHNTNAHGFIFENSGDQTLMNIRGLDGNMYVRGNIYANNSTSNRVFADNYHPNADKWTTARTLSLSGDASGSVSWDGSANATLSVAVANDSHTHDGRYYTESEADTRFTRSNANDTVSGNLNFTSATTPIQTNSILLNNTEMSSSYYSDTTGILAYDANHHGDTAYGTGNYSPEGAFSTDGGGLVFKGENGWAGVIDTRNMQWLHFRPADMTINNINVAEKIIHEGDTDTYTQFNAANSWRVVTGNTEGLKVSGSNVDIPDAIRHTGDTNTYIQFHAADQFRVVTGGTERLEVNNTRTQIDNLEVTGFARLNSGQPFWENKPTVSASYTIADGYNAMSAGPITINSGVTVTVGDGETWTVV